MKYKVKITLWLTKPVMRAIYDKFSMNGLIEHYLGLAKVDYVTAESLMKKVSTLQK